jgi:hypothetical protein
VLAASLPPDTTGTAESLESAPGYGEAVTATAKTNARIAARILMIVCCDVDRASNSGANRNESEWNGIKNSSLDDQTDNQKGTGTALGIRSMYIVLLRGTEP